jgi:hypothetical protein
MGPRRDCRSAVDVRIALQRVITNILITLTQDLLLLFLCYLRPFLYIWYSPCIAWIDPPLSQIPFFPLYYIRIRLCTYVRMRAVVLVAGLVVLIK